MPETLIGQVSDTQIQQWKQKYNDIHQFTADGKVCYLRKPDRKILGYAASLQNKPIQMAEVILANCWLGGCEDFKTDDGLFFGISQKLGTLVQIKEVELAKL